MDITDNQRCGWCHSDELYRIYHDNEWGVPCRDDQTLFEFLILEGAQAGLSWITVLRKREHYREVFDQFDPVKIAAYGPEKVEELLQDPGIIRNKLKVNSAIRNAKAFLKIQEKHGSFAEYIWSFVDGKPIQNNFETLADVPASTEISDRMSKALKKDGFNFVGSTICYAFMQATGMVNDHIQSCHRYQACKDLAES
ncbi:DNA-3-methyladenine glycosylase I [Parendozoicomonas haliclonae]|uniref:DNA-3-methyladenine glycosylase I n=1 Tax=Parendozoicomonas haliclonae TaxID=1960125 RepID=A0A1X7ALR5_9GAMM|nr:DNA-3-methyladenine glycosylase I [Parendozoicomonas haliclonae]SMA48710.1 DNA-3-methyladenine glycosylase 1 [Parendozoicomonas haliclonae]